MEFSLHQLRRVFVRRNAPKESFVREEEEQSLKREGDDISRLRKEDKSRDKAAISNRVLFGERLIDSGSSP